MFVKNLENCEEFTANDGCSLKELLHPHIDDPDLPYSIAVARVYPGKQSYRHRLQQGEVYFILSGEGLMHIDQESATIGEGDVVFIPPRSEQWLENTGRDEIRFIAIVSPPWTTEGDTRLE